MNYDGCGYGCGFGCGCSCGCSYGCGGVGGVGGDGEILGLGLNFCKNISKITFIILISAHFIAS